jgi:cytochrome b pre-mRNA-processing protein 3
MLNFFLKTNTNEVILYNNILLLSRNKIFYTKFALADTFQNRINLIFIHISFIFINFKQKKEKNVFKKFQQKLFDIVFNKIEVNMREIGYGDVSVNKKMKFLVKSFYNILLKCENFKNESEKTKKNFFSEYLEFADDDKSSNNTAIIEYFKKYETFCFDLKSDSVLKGELNFNY